MLPGPPEVVPAHRFQRAAWDWTDVLLLLPLGVLIWVGLELGVQLVVLASSQLGHSTQAAVYRASETIAEEACLALAALVLVLWRRHARRQSLALVMPSGRWLGVAALLVLILLPVTAWLQLAAEQVFGHQANPQVGAVQADYSAAAAAAKVLAVVAIAVVAPIAEEIVFRGFLFTWLRGMMPWGGAAVVSAGVFASAHLIPLLLLPLFVFGLALAVLRQRSGSLLPGMLVHGVFNLVEVLAILNVIQLPGA